MVAYVNRLMKYCPQWNNLIHCLNFFDFRFNRANYYRSRGDLIPFAEIWTESFLSMVTMHTALQST